MLELVCLSVFLKMSFNVLCITGSLFSVDADVLAHTMLQKLMCATRNTQKCLRSASAHVLIRMIKIMMQIMYSTYTFTQIATKCILILVMNCVRMVEYQMLPPILLHPPSVHPTCSSLMDFEGFIP